MKKHSLWLGAIVLLFMALPAFATYTTVDYPGAGNTYAYGNNNSGEIVGYYTDATGTHGFLKDGATYAAIDYPGADSTYAYDINSSGQIVGYYHDSTGDHGFFKDGSSFTPINGLPSYPPLYAHGINDSGQIVGIFGNSNVEGFLKNGNTYQTLPVVSTNINNSGEIVGTTLFLFTGNRGYSNRYGSFFVPDSLYPGGFGHTWAYGINNSGQIVGYYLNVHTQPYQQHAFLKDRDTYVSFDYPGSEATFAYGINDDWEIVGSYRDASGLYHGFLATPVPLPSAEQILSFFDTAVSNGTLTGEGPGKSGDGRLKALRNMIEAASNLIAVGNLEEAYQQLVDAYKKTDGDSHIPDFVEGEATAELAQMILALENSLMQTTSLALAASITSHNPLPPSVWLFGSGLLALAVWRRLRKG